MEINSQRDLERELVAEIKEWTYEYGDKAFVLQQLYACFHWCDKKNDLKRSRDAWVNLITKFLENGVKGRDRARDIKQDKRTVESNRQSFQAPPNDNTNIKCKICLDCEKLRVISKDKKLDTLMWCPCIYPNKPIDSHIPTFLPFYESLFDVEGCPLEWFAPEPGQNFWVKAEQWGRRKAQAEIFWSRYELIDPTTETDYSKY